MPTSCEETVTSVLRKSISNCFSKIDSWLSSFRLKLGLIILFLQIKYLAYSVINSEFILDILSSVKTEAAVVVFPELGPAYETNYHPEVI